MTQEELRKAFTKYALRPTINENKMVLDMFSNIFLIIIRDHHYNPEQKELHNQARLILQMMLTKSLHLRGLVNGVSFTTQDGTILNEIIDPTVIAVSIRNIFETVGMFNLIYRSQNNDNEQWIVYQLWVISGLSYRQRFANNIRSPEVRAKFEAEQQKILDLGQLIEESSVFQNLNPKNQNKIRNRISKKEYLIKFENNEVVFLAWHQLSEVMGIQHDLFNNIYTYFSLYSHPSNVSVFQFGELFDSGGNEFTNMTNFNLKYGISLFSIFLADYINLYPEALASFEQLPLLEQIILNYPNKFLRGDQHSINTAWEALG